MTPSRELDALVAEKVMGWSSEARTRWHAQDAIPSNVQQWKDSKGRERILPHYSTDIAAAWEVVDLLTNDDHFDSFQITYTPAAWEVVDLLTNDDHFDSFQITYTPSNGWFVGFGKHEWSNQEVVDAPHAICLAALKAVEVEVPE